MSLKDAYEEKMQAQLKELGAKLELYKAKAVALGAEARVEIEKELKRLEPIRDNIQARLDTLRTTGTEKWAELKLGVEKTWDELYASVEKIAHRTTNNSNHKEGQV